MFQLMTNLGSGMGPNQVVPSFTIQRTIHRHFKIADQKMSIISLT